MVSALLFLAIFPTLGETDGPAADRAAYDKAAAQVGRDPDAHVKLALWCEAHGLETQRLKHLAIAVLADPRHPLARGLMGMVEFHGHWARPEAVREKAKAELVRQEYQVRRAKTRDTADGHWTLALWCDENGLKDEARAHLTAVVRHDPRRDNAWKRLGYTKHGGRWITEAQIADAKAEAEHQKQADRHWKPLLEKWRGWLGDKDKRKQQEADQNLAAITDPRAVPAICAVLAAGSSSRQALAVRTLGQIDAPQASRALAMLALLSPSPEVRRNATEILKRRDVREFAGALIALVRDPIDYNVRPVAGPGSSGELAVKGKKANVRRLYSPPSADVPMMPGDRIGQDDNGLPVLIRPDGYAGTIGILATDFIAHDLYLNPATPEQIHRIHETVLDAGNSKQSQEIADSILSAATRPNTLRNPSSFTLYTLMLLQHAPINPSTTLFFNYDWFATIPIGQWQLEAQKSALVAQAQLQNDVATIDKFNAAIHDANSRVLPLLTEVSGQNLGESREAWAKWWIDQIGYTLLPQKISQEPPTIVENVPLEYEAQPLPITGTLQPVGVWRMSCFAAGTAVWTMTGMRPIESLYVGDVVMTQSTTTGALRYQPILVTHHNPPSKTFRIALGDEEIVSSEFHRFWIAGKGWVMARDLKVGDTLRTLRGLTKVTAMRSGGIQPVFNLDVADDADFFVGDLGALVHDNTLPDPRLAPFDAPQSLAAAVSSSGR